MRKIVLVVHNIRSCHNVGSLLRTADGLGLELVILSGYTPYPESDNDDRLPHISAKLTRQIEKTALGAQKSQNWRHFDDINKAIEYLKQQGYIVVALEQTKDALDISKFSPPDKIALIVGREVEGLEPEVIDQCDRALFIPMFGHKESFNVAQAAAMALYHCRFM